MSKIEKPARIWFAGPHDRAQGIVAPVDDGIAPGAPGSAEITVEFKPGTDLVTFWFGGIGPDGVMQAPRASVPVSAGLLFDLLIRRVKPAEGSENETPFASLAEHIEARTVELRETVGCDSEVRS